MRGEMTLDPYITHTFEGLEGVNASIEALHSGSCLRAVVHIGKNELPALRLPTLKGDVKVEGGRLKQVIFLFLIPEKCHDQREFPLVNLSCRVKIRQH